MSSKSKGNSFERDISKFLSKWLSNGARDDLFWRTASSGGRATQRAKKGLKTLNANGDVTAVDPEYQMFNDSFIVELKNYKSIDFYACILKKGNVVEWWDKLTKISNNQEKIPILIIKTNNKPILWISDNYFRDKFLVYYGMSPEMSIKYIDDINAENVKYYHIYLFNEIMKLNCEIFKAMMREISGSLNKFIEKDI